MVPARRRRKDYGSNCHIADHAYDWRLCDPLRGIPFAVESPPICDLRHRSPSDLV